MSTQSAIIVAFDCLNAIYREKAFSNIKLNEFLSNANAEEKPLITKIVYGVLDSDIKLEYIIKHYTSKTKPVLFVLLKIGVFCISELSLPQAVVVNDCVSITKKLGKGGVANFVNAVLRNIGRAIQSDSIEWPTDREEKLSVKYSFPMWALQALENAFGIEKTEKIISVKPDICTNIRINTSRFSPAEFEQLLIKKNIKYQKTILDDAFQIYGDLSSFAKSGDCAIMGMGSMLAARAVGVTPNSFVLDLCAAPGGKSVYMANMQPTAHIVSCDKYPHKLRLIAGYAAKMQAKNIVTELNDANEINPAFFQKFDYVLLDAPCSGFGVATNKPEVKINRTYSDVKKLSELQKKMIETAKNYVKVGGVLVYSTCTLFKEENSDVTDYFLANNPDFELTPLNLPVKSDDQNRLDLPLFPYQNGTEGFYMARFIRKK